MKRFFAMAFLVIAWFSAQSWGFFAHKLVNRTAVFTLPPEMIGFYKRNIHLITDMAVNPDMRRLIIKGEAPRHYIDLDVYGDSAVYKLPRRWQDAVDRYTADTLEAYGVVPWHISLVTYQLSQAFLNRDADRIIKLSADLGHYVADANVPLHTTENYNGQFTGQYGIHGFWESRLPELFSDRYNLFTGRAAYVEDVQGQAWNAVFRANAALDSVMRFERELTSEFDQEKKYGFEERGAVTLRVYSYEFSKAYHQRLNGMVERQLIRSIRMVGDLWYTAWVDGGQPDLNSLSEELIFEEKIGGSDQSLSEMSHESGVIVDK